MASFYAELHVEDHVYPVVRCNYACSQTSDARGRVHGKVRHAPLQLLLDVPDHDALFSWANTLHKPLAGEVIFYDTAHRVAVETLAFAAGECVQYAEEFESGDENDGAYRCTIVITAPSFELRAGGPAAITAGAPVRPSLLAAAAAALPAAAQVLAAPVAPPAPSGGQYLALAQAAYQTYAQQLPASLQTLHAVLGEFGEVQGRAKSPESAANRVQRAVDNGWAAQVATPADVLDNLWDAVGTRVVLRDSSPATMSQLTSKLVAAINNGELDVVKIENLYGSDAHLPYLSPENTAEIQEEANLKVTQKPYESGYTATTIFVKYPDGVRGEIQLIGEQALKIANAEHLVYNAFLNKPYLGSYAAEHHTAVAAQIAPIRAGAIALNPPQKTAYLQYLSGSYANARRAESGQPAQPLPFPAEVPHALSVDNLIAVNHTTSNFKLPR